MKCNDVMRVFLELEDYHALPFSVRLHLLFCGNCRVEINRMMAAMDSLRLYDRYEMPGDQGVEIMRAIKSSGVAYPKRMPMQQWISVEIIIIASLIMIQFSESLHWLREQFGRNLDLPLNIVLGTVFSVYSIIFIATHIDELKGRIGNLTVLRVKSRKRIGRP